MERWIDRKPVDYCRLHVSEARNRLRNTGVVGLAINRQEASMEMLVERLDTKLREWRPDIAELVKRQVAEIIDLADQDALDILRSRTIEQEVLDLLDESSAR